MIFVPNIRNIFTKDEDILKKLKIKSVVIESTSRCNLKCKMCPRNSFKPEKGDIDLNLFKKISNYFYPQIELNLSGWGEPLLHREIDKLIQIAKIKGSIVGFTTNATLLSPEKSEKIIKSGLDYIDFSIDAGKKETYEKIRCGGKFNDVINNIKNFINIKNRLNKQNLHTSITFVMMKQNIYELPLMVKLSKKLGVDKFIAKNFNVITKKEEIEKITFSHYKYNKQDTNFLKIRDTIIQNSISLANRLNLNIFIYPTKANKENLCNLALSSIFISHKGDVAICCATGYPVPRMLNKTDVLKNSKIIYGNLKKDKLSEILKSEKYLKCRYEKNKNNTPVECKGCLLSEGL